MARQVVTVQPDPTNELASLGAPANAPWSGSGSGSIISVLKGIWSKLNSGLRNDLVPATTGYSLSALGTLFTQDMLGYNAISVQLFGTYVGTITYEVSNDGVNWFAKTGATSGNIGASGEANTDSGQGMREFTVPERYFRARVSSYTSGIPIVLPVLKQTSLPNRAVFATTTPGTAPNVAIGNTAFVKTGPSTNATSLKTTPGNLMAGVLVNNSATIKFVKFYNKASAPVVGTDVPVAVIGIAPNGGQVNLADNGIAFVRFNLGLAYAVTGGVGDADATAVAGNDVSGWLIYA